MQDEALVIACKCIMTYLRDDVHVIKVRVSEQLPINRHPKGRVLEHVVVDESEEGGNIADVHQVRDRLAVHDYLRHAVIKNKYLI